MQNTSFNEKGTMQMKKTKTALVQLKYLTVYFYFNTRMFNLLNSLEIFIIFTLFAFYVDFNFIFYFL